MSITRALYTKPYQSNSLCYNRNGSFELSEYIRPGENVNCFDSAAGLTTVAGLVGIRVFPKEQTWIQGPYPNTYWGEHSYAVFNNQVYDACSAMSSLINGVDFNHYQKLIKPRWDSEIKDLPITEIK